MLSSPRLPPVEASERFFHCAPGDRVPMIFVPMTLRNRFLITAGCFVIFFSSPPLVTSQLPPANALQAPIRGIGF